MLNWKCNECLYKWKDKSSNHYDASVNVVSGQQPNFPVYSTVDGHQSIKFNAYNWLRASSPAGTFSNGITCFIVFKFTSIVSTFSTEIIPNKFIIVVFGLNDTLYSIFEIDPPDVFKLPNVINDELFFAKFIDD